MLLGLGLVACAPSTAPDPTAEDSAPVPVGCIRVDGAGDYPDLAAALAAAPAGATVEACAEAGSGSLVLDAPVVLVGDGQLIEADPGEPAIRIEADDVSISGFVLHGDADGVRVAGDRARLAELQVEDVGGWGISAEGVSGLALSDSEIHGARAGGFNLLGGDAEIRTSSFVDLASWGVAATDAQLLLSGNHFDGISALSEGDGAAVSLIDSLLSSSGNLYEDAALVGVALQGGALDADADRVSGSPFGIFAADSSLSLRDSTIEGGSVLGLYAWSTAPILLAGVEIHADFESGYDNSYAGLAEELGGGGALLVGDEVEAEGLRISGSRSYGLLIAPATADVAVVALDEVAVEGVGRYGVYLDAVDLEWSGGGVRGLVEPELPVGCRDDAFSSSWYTDRSAAVYAEDSHLSLEGLELSDNAGWGLSASRSVVTLDGSTVSGNGCAGVLDYYGNLAIQGSSFSGSGEPGAVWDYFGVLSVRSSSFADTTGSWATAWEEAGTTWATRSSGYGKAVSAQGSAAVLIEDNAMSGGDFGVVLNATGGEVVGNHFSGMNRSVVYASGEDLDLRVDIRDNLAEDVGDDVFSVHGLAAELSANEIGAQREATVLTEHLRDGEVVELTPSSWVGSLLAASGAEIEVAGLGFGEAPGDGILASDSRLDLSEVVGLSVAGDGVQASWTGEAEVAIAGFELPWVDGDGIVLSAAGGVATLSDVGIGLAGGDGIVLDGLGTVSLRGAELTYVGGDGVVGVGLGACEVGESFVAGGEGEGLVFTDSDVILRGVESKANLDGLVLEGGSALVEDNLFVENEAWGMRCEGVSWVGCSGNGLGDNGLGEASGCDPGCGGP